MNNPSRLGCIPPPPDVLHLISDGPCGGIAFPDDTLTFGPVPGWLRRSYSGNIYVGAASFAAGGSDDWAYVLNDAGLWRARRTTGAAWFLGNPFIARQCGPPFRWPFKCGSSSFGGVIRE